jgi:hypothetical protein
LGIRKYESENVLAFFDIFLLPTGTELGYNMAISELRITFFSKKINLKPQKNTKLFAIGRKSGQLVKIFPKPKKKKGVAHEHSSKGGMK